MEVAIEGKSIGSFLVDELLHDVRKNGSCERRGQDVIASAAGDGVLVAAINPPAQRQYGQDMLIGGPMSKYSRPLRFCGWCDRR